MLFTSFFKHLKTKEVPYSKSREKHLYVSCFLLHFFGALAALQQNRAQSRLLYYVFARGNFWMEKCRWDPGALIFQPIPNLSSAEFS